MAQQDKIGKHIIVTYHETPVVPLDADGTSRHARPSRRITLWGGRRSATTKTRINQAASQLDLGFSVFQRDFQWFVRRSGCDPVPFDDGMQFETISTWTAALRAKADLKRTA